ncbi:MAG: crossover junction endodeoxyribonuclease RuvC [Betaproteobacteria bacterium]|nr:crossover junction endodeoxyribonuclease RuvC [Betaproteobacteria bacterium]
MQHNTILGIDPGTKEMGLAIIRDRELISFGVHTLRNGHRPHDLVGQARRIVLAAIEEYGPQVVAIEKPYMLPTKRAAILSVIEQGTAGRGRGSRSACRRTDAGADPPSRSLGIPGRPRSTWRRRWSPETFLNWPTWCRSDRRARRSDCGPGKYWLHMFDPLGLAVAVGGCSIRFRRRRTRATPLSDNAEQFSAVALV